MTCEEYAKRILNDGYITSAYTGQLITIRPSGTPPNPNSNFPSMTIEEYMRPLVAQGFVTDSYTGAIIILTDGTNAGSSSSGTHK